MYSILEFFIIVFFLYRLNINGSKKKFSYFLLITVYSFFLFVFFIKWIPINFVATLFSVLIYIFLMYISYSNFISIGITIVIHVSLVLLWNLTFNLFHIIGYTTCYTDTYPYLNIPWGLFTMFMFFNLLFFYFLSKSINFLNYKFKFFSNLNNTTKKFSWVTPIMFISLFIADQIYILSYKTNNWLYGLVSFVFYSLIVIFVLTLCIFLIRIEYQKKIIDEKAKLALNIKRDYDKLVYFRHDYKNILLSISYFLNEKDLEGLKTYFYKEIYPYSKKEILSSSFENIENIDNLPLKGLIIEKQLTSFVEFVYIVPEPVNNFFIPNVQLVRLVSIVLDNAIEASQNIHDASITLSILKKDSCILLSVKNPFVKNQEKPIVDRVIGRGNGVSSLRRLIRKWECINYEVVKNDDYYEITIIFNSIQ